MNDKLMKRLDHNISRIKDETVRQLLIDAKADIEGRTRTKKEEDLQTALEAALGAQVTVIHTDEGYPTFRQGAPTNEEEQLATATLCTAQANALKAAHETQVDEAGIASEDKDALNQMMEMTVLMERAGYIGIMETYKFAKYKFPDCVNANRGEGEKAGEVVSLEVTLDDGTTVTLRNPECVEPEQAVPTSVSASATTTSRE